MQKIEDTELEEIMGGAISPFVVLGIFGGFSFLIGIFDGLTRPFRCR